jgi:hypothetical protein
MKSQTNSKEFSEFCAIISMFSFGMNFEIPQIQLDTFGVGNKRKRSFNNSPSKCSMVDFQV